ncbi:MAG: acetylglutamate kinase [Endomicrobiales bacterium]|nr:acetylglutamate kinase [Endomicrobiales bacterium]
MKINKKKIVVIKFGGSLAGNKTDLVKLIAEISKLSKSSAVVLVHGGGPEINFWSQKIGLKPKFVNGLRFTDKATLEIVEMVLSGKINKMFVSLLNARGTKAVGLSAKDANMVVCKKIPGLGLSGEPVKTDPLVLKTLLNAGFMPVLSSMACDNKCETLNVNADSIAMAVAIALKANKLIFLTDVSGVLDKNKKTIKLIKYGEQTKLIKNGAITGGMIPKIQACANAVKKGIDEVWIADGSKGVLKLNGTLITK